MTDNTILAYQSMCVSAKQLQLFFIRCSHLQNEKELKVRNHLLQYVPIGCNYTRTKNGVVENRPNYHRTQKPLSFHLHLKGFDSLCSIQIATAFYQQLRFLGNIHAFLLKVHITYPYFTLVSSDGTQIDTIQTTSIRTLPEDTTALLSEPNAENNIELLSFSSSIK